MEVKMRAPASFVHKHFVDNRWHYEYRKSPYKNHGCKFLHSKERHSLRVRKESIQEKHTPSKAYATTRRYYRELERKKALREKRKRTGEIQVSIPKDATNVWINPDRDEDILATYIDSKGRKQYRYNEKTLKRGEKEKFKRAERFGRNIGRIRKRIDTDLARKKLSRPKVLALVVRLIDQGYFRVGTEKYSIENGSFGISTIRKRHISFYDGLVRFEFAGKKGVKWKVEIPDPISIEVLKRIYSLPGGDDIQLFRFRENGNLRVLTRDMINGLLRRWGVTAKDFRTYHATRICAVQLYQTGPGRTKGEIRKNISSAVFETARHLGHTPSMCRRSYINPKVIDAYQAGNLDKLQRYFPTDENPDKFGHSQQGI